MLPRHASGGAYGTRLELSRAGIRFAQNSPIPLLRTFLHAIYENDGDELNFRLNDCQGESPEARLDDFLRTSDINEVLKRLVFQSRSTLLRAFAELRYGRMRIPSNSSEAMSLERRLLWKLAGVFEPPDNANSYLIQAGEVFRGVIAVATEPTNEWITAVRSSGMDLFVATERLLAEVVEFVAWMLTFDHYGAGRDRFLFSRRRARAWAIRLLNETADSGAPSEPNGDSMGSVLSKFTTLLRIIEQSLSNEREFRRSSVPPFSSHSLVQLFPFRHTRVVCDLSESSVTGIRDALRSVQSEFGRGQVVRVRNQLSHSPEAFPSGRELTDALEGLLAGVSSLSRIGLVPTIYQEESRSVDASGREVRVMKGGGAVVEKLFGPSELASCGMPPRDNQLIIVSGAILRGSMQPLCFRVLQDSDFADEWADYRGMSDDDDDH